MSVRAEKKQETRNRISTVALQLFARNGFATTRTIDVAQAAGVSHGTVFSHFSTREQLVTAVIESFGQRVVERLHDSLLAGQQVSEVLAAHLAGLAEFEDFYARLVREGPLLPTPARNVLIGIQSAVSHHLMEAVQLEMDRGRIRKLPFSFLFNTWLGLLHHYLANRDLFSPDQPVLQSCGPQLLEHYLSLISVDHPENAEENQRG